MFLSNWAFRRYLYEVPRVPPVAVCRVGRDAHAQAEIGGRPGTGALVHLLLQLLLLLELLLLLPALALLEVKRGGGDVVAEK